MVDGGWFYLFRDIAVFFATTMLLRYFLFLIISPWYLVKEAWRKFKFRAHHHKPLLHRAYRPLVSVIVPAWNEEVGIIKTIESVFDSTYDNVEIMVIDDASTDKTGENVKRFIKSSKVQNSNMSIRYIKQKHGGKGVALNCGIQKSSGEIVMTIDADSAIQSQAIEKLVNYFADLTVDAVVGNVKVANNQTFIGLLQSLEYLFGFYYKRAHCVLGAEYILGGACAAFRRATVFNRIGLFDTANKTEDIELSMRIKYNGLKSCYAEDVVCYTEGASTVHGLVNQRLRWKKGRFDTYVKYRRMFFSGDKRHKKTLSWFVLPLSLLAEVQLLFEPIAFTLLLTYSIIASDYVSLALGTLFVAVTYIVVGLFSREFRPGLLFLYPFTWPLFYFLVWVEYLALIRSIGMKVRGEEITWQRWHRQGIDT